MAFFSKVGHEDCHFLLFGKIDSFGGCVRCKMLDTGYIRINVCFSDGLVEIPKNGFLQNTKPHHI